MKIPFPVLQRLARSGGFLVFLTALEYGVLGEEVEKPDEASRRKIEIVVTPGDKPSSSSLTLFTGSFADLHWIVREAGDEPFRLTVDIYQILTSTLAPVETHVEIGTKLQTSPQRPVEASKAIGVPPSERPIQYLVKLWMERGDQRTALSLVRLNGVPPGLLDPLGGRTIRIAGFDPLPVWAESIRRAGAKVESVDVPALDESGAWEGALIVKDAPAGRLEGIKKLATGQRLVAFVDGGAPGGPLVISSRSAGDGMVLTFPNVLIQGFDRSPEAQQWLVFALTSDFGQSKPPP